MRLIVKEKDLLHRREFCNLLSTGAAALAVAGRDTAGPLPEGFNKLTQDYAAFCRTPANERIFYAVESGKIMGEKLDDRNWQPTEWGKAPELPVPGGSWDGVPMNSPVLGLSGEGPYQPTWESLLQYEAPEWYRDAKFGIWAHWSPQCVPEAGDWYARNMYIEGSKDYKYQLDHYGHPSKFGYKELCSQWTLLNWEPEELMERYKKAGAKFFVALANHHDGFDAWDSKHQPWNSINMGPHRDVVGTWAALARKHGLRFGVTVHQARNWWWFQTAHAADKAGALAAVAYDGRLTEPEGKGEWWQGFDPHRIYGVKHPFNALPDTSYVKDFYDRTRDLLDQHDPDLLYFDNSLFPLGWGGMNIGAYFYNHNLKTRGKLEAVATVKQVPDNLAKAVVADYERGLTNRIMPYAWQSETCIGEWHYNRAVYDKPGEFGGYTSPRDVVHWLIDAVSKNGTFVLNVPGKPDGTIDSKEEVILDQVTEWMQVNREAIYATRPWKIYGEGPNVVKAGSFQGHSIASLGAKDIRFTRNKANSVIYAIVLGWPQEPIHIQAIGTSTPTNPGKIERVELLGTEQTLDWKQEAVALRVSLPSDYHPRADFAASLKLTLAG